MKKQIATLLAVTVIAVGCSTNSSPQPVVSTPPLPPPATAPASSVTDWNDRAFGLIKEQRWPEAVEAAQKAVAQDGKSSAAQFNLGRAYLGAGKAAEAVAAFDAASALTGGSNADVEYFRGQAKVANKQEAEAIALWSAALAGPLHGDKEIAAALQELVAKNGGPVAVGDVNGDGKPDLLRVEQDRFQIIGGDGEALYDGAIMASGFKDLKHQIALHALDGGVPLIHVEIPACASAPQNAFYWFNGSKVVPVGEDKGPCTIYMATGHGLFEQGLRAGGIYLVSVERFENGAFKPAGGKSRLMWDARKEQIGYLLTTIVQWPLESPLELFASQAEYDRFLAKVKGGGRWEFQQGGEIGPDYIQVKPVVDGKTLGIANVYLEGDAQKGYKVVRIAWP